MRPEKAVQVSRHKQEHTDLYKPSKVISFAITIQERYSKNVYWLCMLCARYIIDAKLDLIYCIHTTCFLLMKSKVIFFKSVLNTTTKIPSVRETKLRVYLKRWFNKTRQCAERSKHALDVWSCNEKLTRFLHDNCQRYIRSMTYQYCVGNNVKRKENALVNGDILAVTYWNLGGRGGLTRKAINYQRHHVLKWVHNVMLPSRCTFVSCTGKSFFK